MTDFEIVRVEELSSSQEDECLNILAEVPGLQISGEKLRNQLCKMVRLGFLLIARAQGRGIGVIGFYANDLNNGIAHIMYVSVLDGCRNFGIGGALLDKAIAVAKVSGMKTIRLNVLRTNDRAISLYERRGFVLQGEGCSKEHVLMARLL